MMGEEIDGEFLGVVSTRYGVGLYQLCTTIRNRASVNNMAVRGSIQSLDWTSGLDWWTGLVDWTGGLETCGKNVVDLC